MNTDSVVNEILEKNLILRGDESYYDEFDITAEEAMEILGIRRTRLRDISGYELRVGRKRDGRYIRPYYREIDLTQYKEQQKKPLGTGPHRQSAELFVAAIEHQNENIKKEVESGFEKWSSILKAQHHQNVSKIFEYMDKKNKEQGFKINTRLKEAELMLLKFEKENKKNNLRLEDFNEINSQKMNELKASIVDLSLDQHVLKQYLIEILEVNKVLESKLESLGFLKESMSVKKSLKLFNSNSPRKYIWRGVLFKRKELNIQLLPKSSFSGKFSPFRKRKKNKFGQISTCSI